MPGEKDLNKLLSRMSPELVDEEFVFCTLAGAGYGSHVNLMPIAAFNEREGLTLVIPKTQADQHLINYASVFKCITLNVHSSLDAVGLTAAVASRLAENNISANVIAAYFHDHIFIHNHAATAALKVLNTLKQNHVI